MRRDVENRSLAAALALALTDPKKLNEPLDKTPARDGSPWKPPSSLQRDADTRHDVGQVRFETEQWW